MPKVFQVIAIEGHGFAVFQFGGRRSSGKNYTRTAAVELKRWLTERAAGYPTLAPFRTGKELPVDRQFACTRCTGGVQDHARFMIDPKNCTGPCCRKGPKRVRRV